MALIKCTECGGTVSDSATSCPHCGAPIIKCPECGRLIPVGQQTCPNCGAPAPAVVEKVAPARQQQPAAAAEPSATQTPPPAQPAAPQPQGPRRFKIGVGAVVLIAVLVFLIFTRPSQQKHEEVIENLISESVGEMRQSLGMGTGFDAISNLMKDELTKMFMGDKFDVDNYLLFNLGKMHMSDDDHVVTLGIANHVFCFFSKSDVKAAIRKMKDEQQSSFDKAMDVLRSVFGIVNDQIDSETETDGNTDDSDNTGKQAEEKGASLLEKIFGALGGSSSGQEGGDDGSESVPDSIPV